MFNEKGISKLCGLLKHPEPHVVSLLPIGDTAQPMWEFNSNFDSKPPSVKMVVCKCVASDVSMNVIKE